MEVPSCPERTQTQAEGLLYNGYFNTLLASGQPVELYRFSQLQVGR